MLDYFLGIFIYKYVHKLLPAELHMRFAFVNDSHSYNTRAAFCNYLTLTLPKSNLTKRNLLYDLPKLWNSLPNELFIICTHSNKASKTIF